MEWRRSNGYRLLNPEFNYGDLGDALNAARAARRMQVSTLLKEAGISDPTWAKARRGEKVSRAVSVALYRVLGEWAVDGYDDGEVMQTTFGGTPLPILARQSRHKADALVQLCGVKKSVWYDAMVGRIIRVEDATRILTVLPGAMLTSGPCDFAVLRARLEDVLEVILAADAQRVTRPDFASGFDLVASRLLGARFSWVDELIWQSPPGGKRAAVQRMLDKLSHFSG